VEALQTDVMRFMAILGFCLMVIFALVKTMPMAPPDSRPRSEAQKLMAHAPEAHTREERPSRASVPEAQGFILRFSSEKGLQSLIAAGEVGFYAMAGKKAWYLKISPRGPLFVPAEGPALFYEMAPGTVPGPYVRALAGNVAAFGPHTMTWGVTLSKRTIAGIHHQMEGKQGGALVIREDGSVTYTPGRAEKRGYP